MADEVKGGREPTLADLHELLDRLGETPRLKLTVTPEFLGWLRANTGEAHARDRTLINPGFISPAFDGIPVYVNSGQDEPWKLEERP